LYVFFSHRKLTAVSAEVEGQAHDPSFSSAQANPGAHLVCCRRDLYVGVQCSLAILLPALRRNTCLIIALCVFRGACVWMFFSVKASSHMVPTRICTMRCMRTHTRTHTRGHVCRCVGVHLFLHLISNEQLLITSASRGGANRQRLRFVTACYKLFSVAGIVIGFDSERSAEN